MDTPISVGQLNRQAKFILEQHFPSILISGEVSNLARPKSGHLYFTLKDKDAQVRCAFFRGAASRQQYQIREGDAVLVRGKLSLFEGRGDYQVIVSGVAPAGDGVLQMEFAALKKKLEAEGLFDPAQKRSMPSVVTRLGVITSATGAALQDILTVLKRRNPAMEVWVYACLVQGQSAVPDIRRALAQAQHDRGVDALLIARGGGSAEDLWCFNDEALARDIAGCTLPIVSAVGHETDFTIADFVADVRAPTPSAGAELLSTDQSVWRDRLQQLLAQLTTATRRQLEQHQLTVRHLQQRMRHPSERIREQQQRLDERDSRLQRAMQIRLLQRRQRLNQVSERLTQASPAFQVQRQHVVLQQLKPRLQQAMVRHLSDLQHRLANQGRSLHVASPMATLDRGFAITLDQQGQLVRSVKQVAVGAQLTQRLADGELAVTVDGVTAKTAR